MLEQIDHINIVVADLARMTAFYRDVLGMRVTKEVSIRGEWVERTVGLKGVEANVVYLEAQVEGGTRLELIEYISPKGACPPGIGESNARGLRHFAYKVRKINDLVIRLRNAGVKLFSDVQQVPDSQVTYAGGVRKRLIYFHDPEGNLLELCEYS